MRRFSDTARLAATSLAAVLIVTSHVFAQRLPGDVTPSHYDLSFDVDLANARFAGSETIRVELAQPTRAVTLNAAEIAFRQVTIETAAGTQTATVSLDEAKQTATLRVAKVTVWREPFWMSAVILPLEIAMSPASIVSEMSNVALKAGSSKLGNARRASVASNWVTAYRWSFSVLR